MKKKNKKVIVAMSGGVDSSVAAALLKREGFDLIGVFMKFWAESKDGLCVNRCCSPESEKRARLVAEKLKIPFYVFNFEKKFKEKIVDYFLKEEKAGLTPNPCVVCNKEIKFGVLFKKLQSLDFDYIATGHYARLRQVGGQHILLRGKDKKKDQSYFLWQLGQKELGHILFPVGSYTKSQVRALAKKFKLPTVEIPESQEICFVSTTINDFLKRHFKPKPGGIVDVDGKILGKHQGLWFYTIGQRKGIELPLGPYYVLEKDLKKNHLIITKNEKDLYQKELIAKKINWLSGKKPKPSLKVKAKIRYRHQLAQATVKEDKGGRIKVVFSKPQRAIAPGQSVVFYKREELLGGGIII